MAYVPVAAPVYGSVAELEQFASPQTSSRYAVIPGLGMFAWYPLDSTARNGTTVLGTGVIGRWKLSDTFGNGSVWKQACFVAADSNVTLSGAQTIDGQSVTAGKVVFCTAQTAPAENGPWICAAGAWSRPSWFDAAADAQSGAMFPVIAGTTYGGSLWMLTSPTSGTITPGTTAITVEQVSGGGAIVESTLTLPLTLSENQSIRITSTGFIAIPRAASGHVNNTTTTLYLPAYQADGLALGADFNVVNEATGVAWVNSTIDTATDAVVLGDYDPTRDLVIEIHHAMGRSFGTARVQQEIADTTAPRIMVACVPTAEPDVLELWWPEATYVATNPTLSYSAGTTRTITGIKSGNGTTRTVFQLSGNFDHAADAAEVVFAANAVTDLDGNALLAQSVAIFARTHPTELAGFTCYRDGAVELNAADGTWASPSGSTDSATFAQVYADRRPSVGSYDGAATASFDPAVVTMTATGDWVNFQGSAVPPNDTPITFWVAPSGVAFAGTLGGSVQAKPNQVYYVVNADTTNNRCNVSTTVGGAVFNITGDSSGTVYAGFKAVVSSTLMSSLITDVEDIAWVAFRSRVVNVNGAAIYDNDAPMSAGRYWGVLVDRGAGDDTCEIAAFALTGAWEESGRIAMQEGTPLLARRRHKSGNLYVKRDRLTEGAAGASGAVNAGGMGTVLVVGAMRSDIAHDCDVMGVVIANDADQTAAMLEGIETFCMLRPWGGFLRHDQFNLPPRVYARVGVTAYLYWEQVHLTAGGPSQYTYEVSGGGATDATKWTWTPTGGDVGTHTVTITVKLGGRKVGSFSTVVQVVAASSSGTVGILAIGDSWWEGQTIHDRLYAQLVAGGLTPTFYGSRGGYAFTVNTGTDVMSCSGHDFVANEAIDMTTGIGAGNVLPTAAPAIAEYETIYARDIVASTSIKAARTAGGVAIDWTVAQSGTVSLRAPRHRHEGRAGWSPANFLLGNHPSAGVGPFIDPVTERFSAAYYGGTWITGALDIIVLQLGVNGLVTGGNDYTVDYDDLDSVEYAIGYQVDKFERIIAGIRADYVNCKFVLVAPSAPNILQSSASGTYGYNVWRDGWRRTQQRLANRIFSQFGNRSSDGIVVANAQCVDTAGDFPSADLLHATSTGYQKVGDSIAAAVRALL